MPINNGKVGFSTPKTWNPVSALIKKMDDSDVSHAWVCYWDETLQMDLVLDAHETGFELIPFEEFKKNNTIIDLIDPQWDLTPGIRHLAGKLGSSYDYLGALGLVFIRLGQWLRRRWHNPFRNPRLEFCSESVMVALQASGFPGTDVICPEDFFPEDAREFLRLAGR
jgi:hypothetical protein